MSDYSKLKELAEAASEGAWVQDAFEVVSDGIEDRRVARCSWLTDAQYIAAANPVVVLGLIAENERLTNRLEVDPRHDYDGISTRDATVKVLDEQVDQLKAENERLAKTADCWDRLNVQNKALSDSFRAERDQAEQDYKDVVGTIELRDIEISKLRAEVAGLRTGYEAYEQVNAELKADIDRLNDEYDKAWRHDLNDKKNVQALAAEVLRLSAESEVLRHALMECTNSLQGEMLQKFGGQLPEDMHPVTRREYDRDIAEVSGYRAALGQGEQS